MAEGQQKKEKKKQNSTSEEVTHKAEFTRQLPVAVL